MRTKFVYRVSNKREAEEHNQHGIEAAIDRKAVARLCPWGTVTVPARGGWQVFESIQDAVTWKNQH